MRATENSRIPANDQLRHRGHRASGEAPTTRTGKTPGPGRPRKPEDLRELIVRLAEENAWGYTRILGELKKLGITSVGRTTVADILRSAGLDPGPKRGSGSWDEFLKRHAATLWACDFLSVKSATLTGFVDLYVLFFIHLGTRRVIVSGPTANPDAQWVTQQARNASATMADWGLPASHLLLDHDTKFTSSFDAVFESDGTEVKRVGPMAPDLNAYAERWVQTLRTECLDHFLMCGGKHLQHILKNFVAHYHEERPHQGVGNVPLSEAEDEPQTLAFPSGEVAC
ncbi:MAG: Integrase core domain protein, partial [Gemmataceae bacterium]|nr:Integrase core domain protein [Gemmataceae bacterium]